jgi:glycosyltransferase involved in cell wall biosynthesis
MDGWQKRIHENADAIIPIADRPLQSHFTDALRLADSIGAEAVFFPNLDSILYDLGFQIRKNGLAAADVSDHKRIAGIWLRPQVFGADQSACRRLWAKLNRSSAGKLQRRLLRTKWNNLRALNMLAGSNRLEQMTFFFTDPREIQRSNTLLNGVKRRVICDPWLAASALDQSSARERLNLPKNKIIILHAGTSRREKGLKDLCRAFERLSPAQTQRLLLFRIGQVDPADQPWLQALIKKKLACSVECYVSEDELLAAYAACDWVALPYRDQAETSGILVHAAAHQRPVLVSDFGLIGEWTRQFGLGLTFRHKNVSDLSLKLAGLTQTDEGTFPGLSDFAQLHTTASFQSTIIDEWWQAMD